MIGVAAAASALGSLFGGGGLSKRDQGRVNQAKADLAAALNGDASALEHMIGQSKGSATQVGKDAYNAALRDYYSIKGGNVGSSASSTPYVSAQTPAQTVVSDTLDKVRQDLAGGVQTLGAGATNQFATSVGGKKSSLLTLPTNTTQLIMIGGVLVGAFLIFRKHK